MAANRAIHVGGHEPSLEAEGQERPENGQRDGSSEWLMSAATKRPKVPSECTKPTLPQQRIEHNSGAVDAGVSHRAGEHDADSVALRSTIGRAHAGVASRTRSLEEPQWPERVTPRYFERLKEARLKAILGLHLADQHRFIALQPVEKGTVAGKSEILRTPLAVELLGDTRNR